MGWEDACDHELRFGFANVFEIVYMGGLDTVRAASLRARQNLLLL